MCNFLKFRRIKKNMNISLSPEILFYIKSFPVTNTLFWTFLISLGIIFFSLLITRKAKEKPNKIQSIFEVLLEESFSFVNSITNNKQKTKKVFPLIMTLFLFILVANLMSLIPGASLSIKNQTGEVVPLFRTVMSDYGMVLILTSFSIIIAQIVAIIANGPFDYLARFINFKGLLKSFKTRKIGDFFNGLLNIFLGFMDLVGEIAKILSLSFRLFGNIFAGEVLTIVMLFLMPYLIPLPFMLLGLLSAIVQAFVFSVLTLVFINMASEIKVENISYK